MTAPDTLVRCQDCGLPWGIVRPSGTTADSHRLLAGDLFNGLDAGDGWPSHVVVGKLPPVTAVDVVFVDEGSWRWLGDTLQLDVWCDPDTWVEPVELPDWWVRSRLTLAHRWDCCAIRTTEAAWHRRRLTLAARELRKDPAYR